MLTQNINNNGTQILGNDENETGGTLLIGGQTPDMEINFVGGLLTKDTEISGWVIEDKIKVPSGEADLYIAQKNGLKGVIKYYRGHIHPNLDLIEKLVNLNHPNIIKIYEYGKHNGHFYEIMEYAQGGSLDTRNDDGLYKYLPLSEDKVIQICKQIINSYKICHEKGIIHRDIKPANMYYRNTDSSDIVIGDFGISSLYGEEETIYHKTQTTSRTTGYAAPEVLSGIITPKMDYYALGISVWELLTGNDPFVLENGKRRNDAHLLRDTIEGRIVDDLLSREPRISDYMQHLIRGLLVVDEEKRWGYEEVTRYLNGEYVEVAKKEIKAWDYSIENISCTTLEQVGTAIFNNLKSEKLKKEVFRGFLTAFFEDIYPDVAKEMNQIIENSYSDIELCLKKIALLLNPSIPYITQNGYKIGNIDDIVELIQKVPEEMIDVLSEDNKWFYIYFEHLGYKDKIKDILNIMKGNKGKSGFTTMLNLGKIVVLLNNKTIKPFSDNKYKDMLLSDFNQLLNIPVDLQRIILDVIKNKSLEGFLLPWLLTVKPSLRINKINEWSDLVNLINNKDIVVSKDGVAEFSSVQSAINAADNGVTIYIEAGVYEESLTINKKLSFIGSDRNEVIIQQPKKCVCEINCESSFINITFKNTEKYQENIDSEFLDEDIALVKCNSPVRFENCSFNDSFKNGISFANSNGSSIEHCMISNSAYNGIYSQKSNLFMTNVKIAFTGLFGFYVTDSGKLKAESCEIYKTKCAGIFICKNEGHLELTDCKIHHTENGVGIEATSKNSITNISSDNFGEGISQKFKVREFESKAKKEGITLPSENKKNANESSTIGIKEINAPMTGKLIRFCVIDGAVVTQGQTIAICDSMIEIEIKAVASGKVHFVTPIGSNIIGGQTIAMIQGSDISDENFKNMIDLATSMDSVLSKKYPSLEEISSIIQKGNEMMETNTSLVSTGWFWKKYSKISEISQVFSKFNNGSFLWSSMSFWILGIIGLVYSIYLFIDKGIGIFNYSFLACSCGCIIWGFIEGCINVIIDRILIKKNIKKRIYKLNKFSLGNFFIRFILQFLFGGIIGGISAEFVANSTFWYGTAISTVALILNYIYSEGTWDMR